MRGLLGPRWAAGAAGLALALAACGGGGGGGGGGNNAKSGDTGTGQGASGGTFSAFISEPQSLLPGMGNDSESIQVLSSVYQALVDYNAETSQPENVIAESIESQDSKTWTIKIQDGWTFHNGEKVTAQSFVDGWNHVAYGPNAQNNNYFFDVFAGYDEMQGEKPKAKELAGTKAVDDTTIQVELKTAYSNFPMRLGYIAYAPMAKACLDDMKKCNEAPIGNGPFQVDGSWKHNQEIKVKRFENFKGDKAKADGLTYKIYDNISTAYNDLRANTLDVMKDLPPEQLAAAKSQFGDRFIERPSSTFTYLGFPLYQKEFQNPKLRQAFSMAIDREAIIKAIFNGAYVPAGSVVSPVVAGSRENPCGEACTFNPQKAKQLFDEAGGYDGTLTLWFNSGAGHEKWMEAVANGFRKHLGVKDIKFQALDFAKYLPLVDEKKLTGPFRLGWGMDYPSPENYLAPLYGSNGSSNGFGYKNAEFDALIAQGNAAASVEEGVQFYNQAEDLVLQDLPNAPLWFGKEQSAYSENVSNVVVDAFGNVRVDEVTVTK